MLSSHKEVMHALSGLGLSADEANVYQVSLALGARPASVIAQKAGLKRSHTYNILNSLKDKGIVQEFVKNSVRHFSCSPPHTLVAKMEERVNELQLRKEKLEVVIPLLENLCGPIHKQPKVRFYTGKEGIREIFADILRTPNQDMFSFCDFRYSWSSVDDETRQWIKNFISHREKKNIWWRAIAARSEIADRELAWRSAKKRQVKLLEGSTIPAEINIYGSKVALTSTYNEMVGVVIENEQITTTLREVHRVLWNILPDYIVPST